MSSYNPYPTVDVKDKSMVYTMQFLAKVVGIDPYELFQAHNRLDTYYGDLGDTFGVCLGHHLMEVQGDVQM